MTRLDAELRGGAAVMLSAAAIGFDQFSVALPNDPLGPFLTKLIDDPEFFRLIAQSTISFLLVLSALFVVLRNTYPAETTAWAVSMLTLVAGFWIGTST